MYTGSLVDATAQNLHLKKQGQFKQSVVPLYRAPQITVMCGGGGGGGGGGGVRRREEMKMDTPQADLDWLLVS